MLRRPRIELEGRLCSEYLARHHREAQTMQRVRLGRLPVNHTQGGNNTDNPRIYYPLLKWADGLAIYPDRIVLIEAKLKLRPEAVGQILVYRDLIKETEALRDHWNKPLRCEIIYAVRDAPTERAARAFGIVPIKYCPTWARDAYLKRVRNQPD